MFVEVEGPAATVGDFLLRLERDAPPLARIERVTISAVTPQRSASFAIAASESPGRAAPDPGVGGQRHLRGLPARALRSGRQAVRVPVQQLHQLGPRFTIVRGVPYDRRLTTMAAFAMCERCAGEYDDPTDRRFHAQPICCPACGPQLALTQSRPPPAAGDL